MAKRIFKAEGYQGPITFTFEEMTSELIKQNEEAVLTTQDSLKDAQL